MSAPTDYLIDRRRMRRRLGWWRAATLGALALAGLGFAAKLGGADSADKLTPHIARLSIQGLITGDKDTIELIQKIGESENAKALLLSLDRLSGDELVMTQELIANMLGVRREGVTEAALKLQRLGFIRYSRGHITVLNRKALERRVCECYSVVKKEYDRLLPHRMAE